MTEVAGFGSTRLDDGSDANVGQVTQAQTGTGYFKVGRPGAGDLCVPFHGIKAVVPGRSVTLTSAENAQMLRGEKTPTLPTNGRTQPEQRQKARRRAFWRP